jgi:hypothetical protein
MQKRELSERWIRRLEQYTDEKYGLGYAHRGTLNASDFATSSVVCVRFSNGSYALFRHAFFINAPDWKEVAVFTEHCGYHIFPLVDLQIERLEIRGGTLEVGECS